MEASRRAVAFLLTVTITVAPMQGAMAEHDERSGKHAEHMESSAQPVESSPCAHHPDLGDHSDGIDVNHNARRGGLAQSVGDAHDCDCSDNCQCACCNKATTAPALPSLYLTDLISTQPEHIQSYSLFSTSTFVPVKTRPPTSTYPV